MTALYGTSFDDLEDEERDPVSKKPTSIQDQVATDERGRRRFHGAFTGGFSAGYFNTVGSKHGWAPSEFKSSRDERSDKNNQRAEDFMDAEDLGEFGISSRRIRQTKEFTSGSTLAWERGGETSQTQSSTVEGIFAKDLQIAIKPVSDSIGIRMLREMGWRQGRAVGLTTIREAKKHRNLDDVDREQITKVAPHWVASAEDEEVIHLDAVEGHKGLGYSGELKGSGTLSEKYGQSAALLKGKKGGRGITGQAFGVGAFEDEDESVYTAFDLSQYDFALGDDVHDKKEYVPDSSFVPAKSVLSSRKFYAPPKLPANWKNTHANKTMDASALPSRMKNIVEGMNSEQRSLFLGEGRQMESGGRKRKSRWDVKGEEKEKEDDGYDREERERRREREESRNAERAKRIEYPRDENKQRRFMEYLNYVRRGLAMPQPADISRWEWEKEEVEFESKLLQEERAMLPDVRARTKPLAKSALALPILDMMRSKFVGETNTPHMTSTRDEDRLMAVRSEMFGEKTRVKFEWHPAYGLAKLFNVPNPFPGSTIHGLAHLQNKGKKREENVLSTIGLPATAAEFAMNLGMEGTKRREEERDEKMREREKEEREERRRDRDRERSEYDKDEKKRREEEEEKNKENVEDEEETRAPGDLLAAIFGMESSDESEDEEEKKDEKTPPSTSQPVEKTQEKKGNEEEIIRIMDMDDEFGPAPPPGLNQTEGLTGFSVLRFNDEVMKKMRKRKRKIDEREKEEKEKEREREMEREKDKKKSKKAKKEKKEKKSKKKHKKEKSKARKRTPSDSDGSSSDSSVQALD